jgi:hypothetical protein
MGNSRTMVIDCRSLIGRNDKLDAGKTYRHRRDDAAFKRTKLIEDEMVGNQEEASSATLVPPN